MRRSQWQLGDLVERADLLQQAAGRFHVLASAIEQPFATDQVARRRSVVGTGGRPIEHLAPGVGRHLSHRRRDAEATSQSHGRRGLAARAIGEEHDAPVQRHPVQQAPRPRSDGEPARHRRRPAPLRLRQGRPSDGHWNSTGSRWMRGSYSRMSDLGRRSRSNRSPAAMRLKKSAQVHVVAGPDAGRSLALPPGSHTLGEQDDHRLVLGAGVPIARLDVGDDGSVRIWDAMATSPTAPHRARMGEPVMIGRFGLRVSPPRNGKPGRGPHSRPPRPSPPDSPPPTRLPGSPPPASPRPRIGWAALLAPVSHGRCHGGVPQPDDGGVRPGRAADASRPVGRRPDRASAPASRQRRQDSSPTSTACGCNLARPLPPRQIGSGRCIRIRPRSWSGPPPAGQRYGSAGAVTKTSSPSPLVSARVAGRPRPSPGWSDRPRPRSQQWSRNARTSR